MRIAMQRTGCRYLINGGDRKMNFQTILVRRPVNKLASIVTSQRRCTQTDEPMSREKLINLIKLLERKSRLLKHVLGIKTNSQYKNFTRKLNNGKYSIRKRQNPRAVCEYILVKENIKKLCEELAKMKTPKK